MRKRGESKDMNPNDKGENMETPPASPAETITPETNSPDNPQGAENLSSEEVEFNALKGGTQDRIKAILSERDQWKADAERKEQFIKTVTANPTYQPQADLSNPQVKAGVEQLSNLGIATDAKVDQKINQSIGNLIYNFELEKLENRYDGVNGLPKFERSEYEDYINRNPKYRNYDPEDVYNIMYSEEIMDAKFKTRGKPQPSNTSLRPNKTQVREEQWTPESVEARMREVDGKQWYVSNKDLVNKVLSTQLPQQ